LNPVRITLRISKLEEFILHFLGLGSQPGSQKHTSFCQFFKTPIYVANNVAKITCILFGFVRFQSVSLIYQTNKMKQVTIENRKYTIISQEPISKYAALKAEYPSLIGVLIVEGKRGGLFVAVVKENGIFLS
jgi:hypothetical protein